MAEDNAPYLKRMDKLDRLKSYIENEKKYHQHFSTTDGSTEASYYAHTWLYELNKILREEEGDE